jgi:hypothetical protein
MLVFGPKHVVRDAFAAAVERQLEVGGGVTKESLAEAQHTKRMARDDSQHRQPDDSAKTRRYASRDACTAPECRNYDS